MEECQKSFRGEEQFGLELYAGLRDKIRNKSDLCGITHGAQYSVLSNGSRFHSCSISGSNIESHPMDSLECSLHNRQILSEVPLETFPQGYLCLAIHRTSCCNCNTDDKGCQNPLWTRKGHGG